MKEVAATALIWAKTRLRARPRKFQRKEKQQHLTPSWL